MPENESPDGEPDELEIGLDIDKEQKRRLRAVRRGYRASSAVVKDNGWQLEVTYLDGSKVTVSAKLLKLKAGQLNDNAG
jgi:hypothetical protein